MRVYLRDGYAQTILRAATLRQKLQAKLSISPSHSMLTPDQPDPRGGRLKPLVQRGGSQIRRYQTGLATMVQKEPQAGPELASSGGSVNRKGPSFRSLPTAVRLGEGKERRVRFTVMFTGMGIKNGKVS